MQPTSPTLIGPADLAGLAERLQAAEAIGVDTETTALNPLDGRLRLLSLALPEETFLLDLDAIPELGPLREVFGAPRPIKVFHHAKFDLRWLLHHHGLRVQSVFDTMLASQLLHETDQHGLAPVVRHYLRRVLDKQEQRSDWSGALTPAQLAYAATDAAVLLPLRAALRPRLIDAGLARIALIEFAVAGVVAEMENTGVLLDVPAWTRLWQAAETRFRTVEAELQQELAGTRVQLALMPDLAPALNLHSSSQLKQALSRLGLTLTDTHEAALQAIAHQHPVVPKILAWRQLQKAVSAYGDGLLQHVHPKTGRIHAHFQQLFASTGRFSCSQPNLQNIPADPDHRACFTAPPGCKLVVADYSQIELRILAELSGDAAFRRAFEQELDLHRMTASEMFWVPYEAVTPAQRQAAKGINFGLIYGRGANSLAAELGVTVERARELIQRYFETYRGVDAWLKATAHTAIADRELRSLGGRRARFQFDEHDRAAVAAAERAGKNFPIQATNSDILKQAMVQLPAALAPLGARLVNCVHDELVVEAPAEAAEATAEAVRNVMVTAARSFLQATPVRVDTQIGDAWLK
ncbi:MAG: DNA polymerase [Candidatus Sericytochromatia bacterium]|nr:DNA polymerase [Candidatus Sericytochromatia bacterium]